jgi:hypothetical protein
MMGHYDDPGLSERPRHRSWWIAVAVLVSLAAGVGVGYLWRSATEPAAVADRPAVELPAPAPAPAPQPAPGPCVAVAQGGTDLLTQLDRAVGAIGAFDPAGLREVVAEVGRLRDQLERDVAACRGRGSGAPGPAPGPPTPGS